jgi:hypothetical protein
MFANRSQQIINHNGLPIPGDLPTNRPGRKNREGR